MIEGDLKNCDECEYFKRQHERVDVGKDRYRTIIHPSICTNKDFESCVNGERSCVLMRATVCGEAANGFNQIDWEERWGDWEFSRVFHGECKLSLPQRILIMLMCITIIGIWPAVTYWGKIEDRNRKAAFDKHGKYPTYHDRYFVTD